MFLVHNYQWPVWSVADLKELRGKNKGQVAVKHIPAECIEQTLKEFLTYISVLTETIQKWR